MRRHLSILGMAAAAACASNPANRPLSPGYNLSRTQATALRCDYDALMLRVEYYRGVKVAHPDTTFVPQVGMPVCELLAQVGAPEEVRPFGGGLMLAYSRSISSNQNPAAFLATEYGPRVVVALLPTRGLVVIHVDWR